MTQNVGPVRELHPHDSARWRQHGDWVPHVNVGDAERIVSAGIGGAMAICGLWRMSLGGFALAALGGCLVYRGLSGHCGVYQSLGLNSAEPEEPRRGVREKSGVKVEKSVTVNRPPDVLYRQWRNLENLPRIMRHLESVKVEGNKSHWKAKAPLGMNVEWEAEIINERPNELIAWQSIEGSEVDTAGSVHFRPTANGRGTELRVVLKYDPPAGKVGATAARWLGEAPEQQVAEDLESFKQHMESGAGWRS
jgi:uncharacterized membrane protein